MSDDSKAIWSKMDKLHEDISQLKVDMRTQDYRLQLCEDRFERVMEKIAQSRGEAHQESQQIATLVSSLTSEIKNLRDDVSEAKGGIRFGKWVAGILLTVVIGAGSILAKVKGGG